MSSLQTKKQIEPFPRFSIVEIARKHRYHGKMRVHFVLHAFFPEVARYLSNKQTGLVKETSKRVLNSHVEEHKSCRIGKPIVSQANTNCVSFNRCKSINTLPYQRSTQNAYNRTGGE